jgi:hypothetical protein
MLKILHGEGTPPGADPVHVANDMDLADLLVVSSKQYCGEHLSTRISYR